MNAAIQKGALSHSRLPASGWRTRFAPAPTGYLHLGHLVNAIHVWGLARAFGGHVMLRIEDHDRTRCKPEFESALLEDLDWLGFVPDEGATHEFRSGPTALRQSDNNDAYETALSQLIATDRVYACTCSRRDVLSITGPVAVGEEAVYPGTCRNHRKPFDITRARRVRIDEREVSFDDLALGEQRQVPAQDCGDVLVRDRFGHWTYQFAVVVDDFNQRVDVVIRGEDLLGSTGRQILIAEMLGRRNMPQYWHHMLIRHADGTKLSKAAHDTSLRELRSAGISAATLIGEAAWRAGLQASPQPVSADEVSRLFA